MSSVTAAGAVVGATGGFVGTTVGAAEAVVGAAEAVVGAGVELDPHATTNSATTSNAGNNKMRFIRFSLAM
jgi:hypothetical protein